MKQERKAYRFGLPVTASSVVLGFVDHGVMKIVWLPSAISEAGIA